MNKKDDEEVGFKYTPDDTSDRPQPTIVISDAEVPNIDTSLDQKDDEPLFNWSAPDSFSPSKSTAWYFSLIGITVVVCGLIYLITRDKITTAVILVCALVIGVYAGKKPKMIKYQLTRYGFTINGRYYEFGRYRSFAVVRHGSGISAVLTPLKRFMPYVYIYFDNDMEQQVTSALTDVLPKETAHNDAIDRVLRRIGF